MNFKIIEVILKSVLRFEYLLIKSQTLICWLFTALVFVLKQLQWQFELHIFLVWNASFLSNKWGFLIKWLPSHHNEKESNCSGVIPLEIQSAGLSLDRTWFQNASGRRLWIWEHLFATNWFHFYGWSFNQYKTSVESVNKYVLTDSKFRVFSTFFY